MLATTIHGDPSPRPPLLIAHGLFGSARNWGVLAKRLADERQVIVPDMRNHGASPFTESHDYPGMAADLAELIDDTADVMGHSMGGKAAMALALTAPQKVRRLIVLDIAPVAYGHGGDRLAEIAAMRRVDLTGIASRKEAAEQLGIADPVISAFLLQSLDMAERRWRLNLDVLERDMAGTLGFPETVATFDGPVLFLSGEASPYVGPAEREAALRLFPAAEFEVVKGAGHWVHAEKPREVEAAVRAFLDRS